MEGTFSPEAQLLRTGNKDATAKAAEEGKGAAPVAKLRERVTPYIVERGNRAPLVQPTITEEVEGSVGFLSTPAKRAIVTETLAGNRPPPMRTRDEETPTGEPQHTVDKTVVHIIVPVNPANSSVPEHVAYAAEQIATAAQLASQGETQWVDPKDPTKALRTKSTSLAVHFVLENAFGARKLITTSIGSPEGLPQALDGYNTALSAVTKFDPVSPPTQADIAYQTINEKLVKLQQDEGSGTTIHVPLFVRYEPHHNWSKGYNPSFEIISLNRVQEESAEGEEEVIEK